MSRRRALRGAPLAALGRLAMVVVALSLTACAVTPAPATVVGPAPDTRRSALAAREGAEPQPADGLRERPSTLPPLAETAVPDEVAPVLLWGVDGVEWVQRETGPGSGDAVIDAVARLARPLDEVELARGLTTQVPPDTVVVDYAIGDSSVRVDLQAAPTGGTEVTLAELSLQVSCTVQQALALPPEVVVEVTLAGTALVPADTSVCF